MAVKRTGASKITNTLSPGKTLEILGRPLFWLLLGSAYFLIFLFSFLRKIALKLGQFVIHLSGKLFGLPKKARKLQARFLFQIKLPKQKIPRFKPPRIKLLKVRLPRLSLKRVLIAGLISFLISAAFLLYFYILKDLPQPEKLTTRNQALTTRIYDRNGELLYKIYRNQNRTLVSLEEIPLVLVQATIAIEDAEFYQHPGFSLKGISRAFFKNLQGEKLYGGSTLTQQLIKNALLTPERTFRRKIKEVVLALWTEQKFNKDEILQMYFNEVGYGGAAYGVEEAAQMYFDKPVSEINLAEAALLAGLPASPSTYSPFGAYPERAKERQLLVLRRMRQEGFITEEERQRAGEEEIALAPQRTDIKAPHFVMWIKSLLAESFGLRLVEEGGLEVKTSLDLKTQETTQEIVSQEVAKLTKLRVGNGAALITSPQTGEVLAMVGSKDYFNLEEDGNVNVTLRPRQPGSSIKPVMYSLALENGFTPATIIPDSPVTYQTPGFPPYSPHNYDNRFHGNVPLRIALASSYNVPAVKVLSALGVNRMIERGQAMGITTWENPSRFGLSLTLGGGEVKMVDMAVAYGTLANLGTRVDLNPILEVKNHKGKVIKASKQSQADQTVIDPRIAYILTDILSDNQARTPAFGPGSVLNIKDRPHVAAKTGTTQNLRDNWTLGYTPDFLVAVWVGNNDNTPMSQVASGVTGASPIWQKIMTHLLKDLPDKEFSQPEGLVQIEICPTTGTLPCNGCGGKGEYFLPGTEPKTHCQPKEVKESEKES